MSREGSAPHGSSVAVVLTIALALGCSGPRESTNAAGSQNPASPDEETRELKPPLYIDATALVGLPPQKAIDLLQKSPAWNEVSYNPKTGVISLKAAGGVDGLVQYDRGVLLSLRLTLPQERVPVSKETLRAIGIRSPPEPSVVESRQGSISVLKWERGFDQFHMVIVTKLADVTVLGVDYVPRSVIEAWEQQG